ncbi:MAG: hypothetical protein SYR96_01370 [Actinomycetota bacterium]|nr:hypothetical protein [Actinomycetota bacterium]
MREPATAFTLALSGAFDHRTVNIADESTPSIHEMSQIVGCSYGDSAAPLSQPWRGQMDVSLARGLGFTPTISTIYKAARNGAL